MEIFAYQLSSFSIYLFSKQQHLLIMSRLVSDPNLEHCLDFTSINFQASRAPLLNPATDDGQAAVMLQTIWVATNATLKTQWQHQLDEDALAAGE